MSVFDRYYRGGTAFGNAWPQQRINTLAQTVGLNADDSKVIELAARLLQAAEVYEALTEDTSEELTASQLRKELTLLQGSLVKALNQLRWMGKHDESVLDQYHYLATKRQDFFDPPSDPEFRSRFAEAVSDLHKTVQLRLEDIAQPGSGNNRRKPFVFPFTLVTKAFIDLFPNAQLGASKGSRLHSIACIWLELVEASLQDPERQLAEAVAQVRADHQPRSES